MLDLFVEQVTDNILNTFQIKRLLELYFEILCKLFFLSFLYIKSINFF